MTLAGAVIARWICPIFPGDGVPPEPLTYWREKDADLAAKAFEHAQSVRILRDLKGPKHRLIPMEKLLQ